MKITAPSPVGWIKAGIEEHLLNVRQIGALSFEIPLPKPIANPSYCIRRAIAKPAHCLYVYSLEPSDPNSALTYETSLIWPVLLLPGDAEHP